MKNVKQIGVTLIELLIFIIITSIVVSTLLLSSTTTLLNAPTANQQRTAIQTAQRCMEWFINQRRIVGYSTLTCPSNPAPTACTAPSGFSVSTSIVCSTWNSDSNYKTITVTVSGLSNATLSTLIGDYQ